MFKITINKKGQITIPKSIRDKYKWTPKTSLEILDEDGKISLRLHASEKTKSDAECKSVQIIHVY